MHAHTSFRKKNLIAYVFLKQRKGERQNAPPGSIHNSLANQPLAVGGEIIAAHFAQFFDLGRFSGVVICHALQDFSVFIRQFKPELIVDEFIQVESVLGQRIMIIMLR